MRGKACLIVMGSEGRGEQTIRTDQDNGLILSEPVDEAKLQEFRDAFSGALAQFGFPPCPGRVMVNNPLWSRTIDQYIADFSRWTTAPDEQSAMNVAIFYDAESVAGDASLLLRAKKALIEKVARRTRVPRRVSPGPSRVSSRRSACSTRSKPRKATATRWI